jgi:hypothetical protein
MPTEVETDKPEAKTKEQIIAEFRKLHKYGIKLSEIKAGAAEEDSTAIEPSKQ